MMGSAAFFAPDTATSPSSGRPPWMRSLSTRAPLLRGQRAHRQRVDLLAHALAERAVHQLMALHAILARERAGDDERLEMLAVADDFEVLAGNTCRDSLLDAVRGHHIQVLSLYPVFRSARVSNDISARLTLTTARLAPGGKSETPKKP